MLSVLSSSGEKGEMLDSLSSGDDVVMIDGSLELNFPGSILRTMLSSSSFFDFPRHLRDLGAGGGFLCSGTGVVPSVNASEIADGDIGLKALSSRSASVLVADVIATASASIVPSLPLSLERLS